MADSQRLNQFKVKHFTREDIDALHKYERIQLINSCPGLKSANLIGTVSDTGQFNCAIFSSVIHMGSNPPMIGYITRPARVERHTFTNIKQTGVYTINAITNKMIVAAHQTSAKYPQDVSEFEAVGLKHQKRDCSAAPFVADSPISIALKLVESHHIAANDTVLIVGEVTDLFVDESLLRSDMSIDLEAAQVVGIGGVDAYHQVELIKRFGHATV